MREAPSPTKDAAERRGPVSPSSSTPRALTPLALTRGLSASISLVSAALLKSPRGGSGKALAQECSQLTQWLL